MNETCKYAEAMRTVVAGLRILREHAKANGLDVTTTDLIYAAESRIADEVAPWEPEPTEAKVRPWSQIVPGDEVRAPNGQWYHVDSVARLDVEHMAALLVCREGKIKSTPRAGDEVPVRRGDAGRAVDVFTAGGLDLEVVGR